jgi:hypothetical protein
MERICIAASITCAEAEDEQNRRCMRSVLSVCATRSFGIQREAAAIDDDDDASGLV